MSNIHHFIIPLTALAIVAAGCSERAEKEADLVEKTTRSDTTATATLTTSAVEPVETHAPEPAPEQAGATDETSEVVESSTKQLAFEPEVHPFDGLSLERFVTTSSIEHREPVGASAIFGPGDERVYAFIEASNESSAPKTLLVYFLGPGEKVSGGIELEIPAAVPRWRTWAYTRHAKAPGLWRVEIRGLDGTLIGALPFEIESDE